MAAKDISLVGATFYAVPQVDLPISGGGTASFVEISDTTATATDVASGKYFYTSAGVKTEGTASGGSANIEELNVTQNGTYTASGGVDGYSPVIVNVSGGGGDPWSWMGKNPTKVKDYGTTKVYLKNTNYNTWTPTTSATQIVASANLEAYTGDFSTYDYIVYQRFHTHFEYGSGRTTGNYISDFYWCVAYGTVKYRTTYAQMVSGDYSTTSCPAVGGARQGLFYASSNGTSSYTAQTAYGVYPYNTVTPTVLFSSSSITPKTPQLNARCQNTYFSTTNASAVNKDTSYYEINTQIWRIDGHTTDGQFMDDQLRVMWLNGIS